MKIKTLKKLLDKCDENMEILVDGYEGGIDSKMTARKIRYNKNVNTSWYYGKHEEDRSGKYKGLLISS